MSGLKVQYNIEFVYNDNGQMFSTGAMMTAEEKNSMERVLEGYARAGAIQQVSVFTPFSVDQEFSSALGEIMTALEHEVTDGDDLSVCQNCEVEWPDAVLINPIPDLLQRVAPGEPMPSGECPSCGAVCQPKKEAVTE